MTRREYTELARTCHGGAFHWTHLEQLARLLCGRVVPYAEIEAARAAFGPKPSPDPPVSADAMRFWLRSEVQTEIRPEDAAKVARIDDIVDP